MKMHLEKSDQPLINDYGHRQIVVDGKAFHSAILVSKSGVRETGFEGTALDLTQELLQPLIQEKPEIIVFGSGEKHQFPPMKLIADLAGLGVALEVMSTSAACRTYNVLVSEFRDVAAALLPIEAAEHAPEDRTKQENN